MKSPQDSGTRPWNLPFRIAPWCLAGLLGTSCSRRDEPTEPFRTAKLRDPISGTRPHGDHMEPLDLYAAVLRSASNSADRQERLASFYREWGGERGREAVGHAMVAHPELARYAFEGWLRADPAAPREWVLSERTDSRWQARLATGLLRGLPEGDSLLRAEWAAHFAGMENGAPIISEVALGWDAKAPERAFDWLAGLADGEARDGAIQAFTQRWIKADPEGASTHLGALRNGSAKDVAIGALAVSIATEDPEAARLWIAEISEVGRRNLALSHIQKLGPRD